MSSSYNQFKNFKEIFNKKIKNNKYVLSEKIGYYIIKYLSEINNKFKVMHSISNIWNNDEDLFAYEVNSNIYKNITQKSALYLTKIFTNENEYINKYYLYNYYLREFEINFSYKFGDINKVRDLSKENLQSIIYKTIINMIPYIYNKVIEDMYEIFNISKDDYIIKIGKIYEKDNGFKNNMMPYMMFENKNQFNIVTGDIRNTSDNSQYIIIFPYQNDILSSYYNIQNIKLNGKINNKIINGTFTETSDNGIVHNYEFNDTFDNFIINGTYMLNSIIIGNISNYINICIINKKENSSFMFSYNRNGDCARIIQSTNSINWVSTYNKRNKNKFLNNESNTIYNQNINTITTKVHKMDNELFTKLKESNSYLWDKLKKFIYENKDSITNNDMIPLFYIDSGPFAYLNNYLLNIYNNKLSIINDAIFRLNIKIIENSKLLKIDELMDQNYEEFLNENKIFSKINNLATKYKIINLYCEIEHTENNNFNIKKFDKYIDESNKFSTFGNSIFKYCTEALKDYCIDILVTNINKCSDYDDIIASFNSKKEILKEIKKKKLSFYNNMKFDDCISNEDINNKLFEINYYAENMKIIYTNLISYE